MHATVLECKVLVFNTVGVGGAGVGGSGAGDGVGNGGGDGVGDGATSWRNHLLNVN